MGRTGKGGARPRVLCDLGTQERSARARTGGPLRSGRDGAGDEGWTPGRVSGREWARSGGCPGLLELEQNWNERRQPEASNLLSPPPARKTAGHSHGKRPQERQNRTFSANTPVQGPG